MNQWPLSSINRQFKTRHDPALESHTSYTINAYLSACIGVQQQCDDYYFDIIFPVSSDTTIIQLQKDSIDAELCDVDRNTATQAGCSDTFWYADFIIDKIVPENNTEISKISIEIDEHGYRQSIVVCDASKGAQCPRDDISQEIRLEIDADFYDELKVEAEVFVCVDGVGPCTSQNFEIVIPPRDKDDGTIKNDVRSPCTGNGTSVGGSCTCDGDWIGAACDKAVRAECKGNGAIQTLNNDGTFVCECNGDWIGEHCTISKRKSCSGNGNAVIDPNDNSQWSCQCDAHWLGEKCSVDARGYCHGGGQAKLDESGERICACDANREPPRCRCEKDKKPDCADVCGGTAGIIYLNTAIGNASNPRCVNDALVCRKQFPHTSPIFYLFLTDQCEQGTTACCFATQYGKPKW